MFEKGLSVDVLNSRALRRRLCRPLLDIGKEPEVSKILESIIIWELGSTEFHRFYAEIDGGR